MPKRSKKHTKANENSQPFSVKLFKDDYATFDTAADAKGIPKSILFRLVMREAIRDGILTKLGCVAK